MDRRHLRCLIALDEEGSITRAAERLGIAQPPLSMQIKGLEREIGVPLFTRQPRGVVPTPAGRVLIARAREIERAFQRAQDEARRIGEGRAGRLRVGFTESGIFNPVVIRVILDYRAAYPDVDLALEEHLSTEMIARLARDELDLGFVRPPLPPEEGWTAYPVAREAMVVALPLSHRFASRTSLHLEELADETFVFFHRRVRPGLTDRIISACEKAGFAPRTGQVVPKITSALRMVAVGAGITIVPASLVGFGAGGVAFVALGGSGLSAEIVLLGRENHPSAAARNFIRQIAPARPGGSPDRR